MPFPSALTSDNYDQLRGTSTVNPTYWASEFVLFGSNIVVFQALVNGAPSSTGSYAQITFDTVTVGAYTDIKRDMLVLIGADSDKRNATFVGRVRMDNSGVVATTTVLNINETSAIIPNNANIWVIRDYRLFDRLSRQVGNTQKSDYNLSYRLASGYITGIQSTYARVVSGSPSGYTIAFAPTWNPIAYGTTVNASTWVWDAPTTTGTVTYTVGSSTSAAPTIRFGAGYSDYVTVQVTDNSSHIAYFHFYVGAVPTDFSSVITPAVNNVNLTASENGWDATIDAFAGVDALLDNTLCVVFDIEVYNGAEGSINSNVRFVGRIRKETNQTSSDATYLQVQQATYDIEGPVSQFSRVEHLPFTLRNIASPTVFDEMANLSIWRGIAYSLYWRSTFLELFPMSFDSTDNTFLYSLLPTQGGNIYAIINELAININAVLQVAPTGEAQFVRNANFLSTAQRNALVTVANFDKHDYIDFTLEYVQVDTAGKVQAYGGYYNPLSGNVIALASIAPGLAQGIGQDINTFSRNVLAATSSQANAQAELNARSGNQYEIVRRPQPQLVIPMPDGYTFITPSDNAWYTWTIEASEDTGGRAFTTADRWLCIAGSQSHDAAAGTKAIEYTFRLESEGAPGQTPPVVPQQSVTPALPTIPPLPAFPSLPPLPSITLPLDPTIDDMPPYTSPVYVANGNILALMSGIQSWVTQNALLTSTPTYNEDTPPSTGYTLAGLAWVGNGQNGLYILLSNSTTLESEMVYIPNAIGLAPVFNTSDVLTGDFEVIRVCSTTGSNYILGNNGTTAVYSDDLATGLGAQSHVPSAMFPYGFWASPLYTGPGPAGTYNSSGGRTGGGRIDGQATGYFDDGFQKSEASIVVDLGAECTVIQVSQWTKSDVNGMNFGSLIGLLDSSGTLLLRPNDLNNSSTTWGQFIWSGSQAGVRYVVCTGEMTTSEGTPYLDDIAVTYIPSGTFSTLYSTDFGATYGSPQSAGDRPFGGGGMDTVKVGSVVLVGASGQVMIATAGGSYSAYGDPLPAGFLPTCIHVPYYAIGSNVTLNSSTTPDYVVASSVADGAGETMYLVTSAGTVFNAISPTVSAIKGTAVSANCLHMPLKSGTRMACVLDFSGTRKLVTSIDIGTADTFTSRGAVGTGAASVRYRKSDTTFQQICIGNGSTGLLVSQNNGSTLQAKGNPGADAVLYAEFF